MRGFFCQTTTLQRSIEKSPPISDHLPTMILGMHHVQITVPIAMEATAIRFYTDVLSLQRIDKPDALKHRGGTWFQLGEQQLHLGIEDGISRRASKAHVAYLVDDLNYWRKRLTENEVTPIESIPIPGYNRFEARDPFGNRIEFIQRVG
jgi:catechol 2,3-dioxygenase-like lactoylglutathione lyase family enzyme